MSIKWRKWSDHPPTQSDSKAGHVLVWLEQWTSGPEPRKWDTWDAGEVCSKGVWWCDTNDVPPPEMPIIDPPWSGKHSFHTDLNGMVRIEHGEPELAGWYMKGPARRTKNEAIKAWNAVWAKP